MSYLHISNLYKPEAQAIFMFREVYALEKIHGTSAHITFKTNPSNPSQWQIVFSSGGEKYNNFIALFDEHKLMELFKAMNPLADREYTIYGEAYGGNQQGMSDIYGTRGKFIAFDVLIGTTWLDVPNGEKFVKDLGLEYVPWVRVPIVKAVDGKVETDLTFVDAERDAPSVQSVRNGITGPKPREGVVLRPIVECTRVNGDRIIAKHKGDNFCETATPRKVVDPNQMQVLSDANAIADEWMTATRLQHILDKIEGERDMKLIPKLIPAAQEDVRREGRGEIIWSDAVAKSIGKKAVDLYKAYLNS